MKRMAGREVRLGPGWSRLDNNRETFVNSRAWEPVCRRAPNRAGREGRRPSGWPSSEPCTAGADGQVLQFDPSVCGTCSKGEPLSRYCPKQYRQRSCAWEGWGEREVLLRHRRVGRVGLRERGPFFPVFQWLEQYGHFPREKCSSVEARFAFLCPLGKTSFLRAAREDGRR